MKKPLPIGVDIFEQLITNGYYYVDKTNLIKDIIDQKGSVNLFTRPRRFGKTLNMSMLQYYFEDMRDRNGAKIDNSALFEGLSILQAGEQYTSQMGQSPVIFMSLKDGKQRTLDSVYDMLFFTIQLEYRRHEYVLTSNRLTEEQINLYRRILSGQAEVMEYKKSLRFLSECLEAYYGQKVIILLDEYDVPLENAFVQGFYDEMIDFMRGFLSIALKTNPSLHFAVITGCLRISKESIFTGLNNLNIVSILNSKYDEYFGFTESEVMAACEYYGFTDKYDTLKEWYNGYIFGQTNVYNPWSVIKYLYDLNGNENCYPQSYWANTSSNSIVRELIEHADESVRGELETLIDGGTIEKPVHEDITYGEIYESMDNLWNFMFFTGYFRKVSERYDENERKLYLTLRIPNYEVDTIFREHIRKWFDSQMKQRDLSALQNAFIEKDTVTIEDELNDILLETISSSDEHENYYHGLVAGLLTGIKGYMVKSNRESGKGRSDLVLKPVSRRKEAFIIEFKVTKDDRKLDEMADVALQQITDRQYDRELQDEHYRQISHYGIAFCGKECVVKLEQGQQIE